MYPNLCVLCAFAREYIMTATMINSQNELPPLAGNPNQTVHRIRSVILWTAAVGLSLLINIALFGLMPRLTDRSPEPPGYSPPAEMINVIRIKKPEPPVRLKKPEKKEKLKTPPPKKQIIEKKSVSKSADQA